MPYPWECIDCKWLDTSDSKYGEYYCNYNHYYVKAYSPSCNHIEKKSSNSNCYLTTIMCNILGYEDNCEILNKLRFFRDTYMKGNETYQPLLDDYDVIGPEICKYLEKDYYKELISRVMLEHYIDPAIMHINNEEVESAINIYKNMTLCLADYYNMDISNLNCSKEQNKGYQRVRKDEK